MINNSLSDYPMHYDLKTRWRDLDKEKILDAPVTTPLRRLDETKANRELNLRWIKSET